MADKLMLSVVTPHGSVLKEEVDEAVLPGSMGELGILPGHISFVTMLSVGLLTYRQGGATRYVFINSGYMEVSDDTALILADSAELSTDIDIERAKESMKRAEERLRKEEDVDFARAEAALERAVTRIEVSERSI